MRLAVAGSLLAVGLAATWVHGASAEEKPPPGNPRFAVLRVVEGAPADSLGRLQFWAALRGTFARRSLETERASVRPGRHEISVPIPNRFVLLEGSLTEPTAHAVQLTLEWLPAVPASAVSRPEPSPARPPARDSAASPVFPDAPPARVHVAVLVWPPGVDPDVVRPLPARDTLVFLAAADSGAAFAAVVGEDAAMLVLERLHHISEDLGQDERIRMAGVRRLPVGPAPAR